ncbi:MAG: hypothetical protein KKG33_05955 [candidate division Zixibacteria bacterium]|nr:hypothetical protein [candidate division Zixibacteria bacterium]MBU1471049.1 hypothetical protein [candidate division Zixibacteria bacterium]MBU2625085.1 hypothetical protein [candidate division Zixibacteria bacterium]
MNTPYSLKELERRAYRSTFEDGIYDILFGLLFLIFAAIPILEAAGLSRFIGYSLLIIPPALPLLGKRLITIPRMGAVEFGPRRKSRRRLILIITGIVIFLMLPIMISTVSNGLSGSMGWMVIALLALPVFIIAVYAMDFPRLWIYAALLLAGPVESEFLLRYIGSPLNTSISFGLPGVVVLIVGLSLLFSFIQKYPKVAPEANHAG